ncbi:MAG TPA: amino acid ABC transporter permease [Ktedonobacterales bacterium]
MQIFDPIIQFLKNVVTLNGSFNWSAVVNSLFLPFLLHGLIITIILSVIAQLLGTLIGLLLYFLRRSRLRVLRGLAGIYIWLFRGTPLLVQVYVIYLMMPYLRIARPLRSIDLFGPLGFQNIFLDAFLAGLIAFSLNEGAYMAEIVRAGIDSIDAGQMEAAKSLGMTYMQGMQRIVLPQAMRVIIPPLGNEFNNMLKSTSLAAVIGLNELLGSALQIGNPRFLTLELLITASIWYLVLTTVWGLIQSNIERRFNLANVEPGLEMESWWERAVGIKRRPAVTAAGVPIAPVPEHRGGARV